MASNRVLFLALLLIAAVLISGCVSQDSPSKASSTQLSGTPTPTPQQTQPTTPTELNLRIGETARTAKIEVTVISAVKTKSYDYYSDILKETMQQEASPGKTFVLVEAEIKNVGADSAFVGSSEFSIADAEGYKYDPTLYYGQGTDGLEMIKQLYQNQRMRGKVLFEIPETAQSLKIQYDFGNLLVGTKLAAWTLD